MIRSLVLKACVFKTKLVFTFWSLSSSTHVSTDYSELHFYVNKRKEDKINNLGTVFINSYVSHLLAVYVNINRMLWLFKITLRIVDYCGY